MSFEKSLDSTGTKKKEFAEILDIVAASPRPKTDYEWLSPVDFLGLDFLRRVLEVQTSYMLLLRSSAVMFRRGWQPAPIAEKGYLSLPEILEWSQSVGMRELYETYCTYPHRGLITLLTDLKLEKSFFDNEFAARMEDKPFTSEMILIDWSRLDREAEIATVIKNKSRWSFRQSNDDIKSQLGAIGELWRKPGSDFWSPQSMSGAEFSTPLPEFPGAPYIEMLPPEKEFWEGPMARAWRDGKMAFLREAVPVLSGEKEHIPEQARSHRRNEWETMARQQRILDEWAPDIESELHTSRFDQPGADVLLSARAYRLAEKRAGEKGVAFLKALPGSTILRCIRESRATVPHGRTPYRKPSKDSP